MTKREEEFHIRMNEAISEALENLRADFDITKRDIDPSDRARWQVIRGDLKEILLKAYLRKHSI